MNMNLNHKIALPLTILFALTTFFMVIIAIAGPTGNYTPLKHVYIGQLNLTHLNISKVLPELSPILTVFGTALECQKSTGNDPLKEALAVFDNLTNTSAFNPLLTVFSNADNITSTVDGFIGLDPLKDFLSSSSHDGPINEIRKLVDDMKNGTDALKDLGYLIGAFESNDSLDIPAATLFQQFKVASNVSQYADALGSFNDLLHEDSHKLQPLFGLFQHTKDDKAALAFLNKILNFIFPSFTINSTFEKLEHTAEKDLNKTLDQLEEITPQSLKPGFEAI
ncbi:hypothetical protein ZYGR_0AG05600 [Zygosaccharomyces rouxii]|uniref:Uncharacterized protein n=1 Tax=Zygosaccharomyces rouxii TaxID=4956 RepID=A0A1Q3A9Y8_ZYGRO|nr:hypothetical protein ZYGR_0AG05600 [Zygosaccharomyces rouxii]